MKRTKQNISAPILNHLTLGKKSSFDYTIENDVLLLRFGRINYFLAIDGKIIINSDNPKISKSKDLDIYKRKIDNYFKSNYLIIS